RRSVGRPWHGAVPAVACTTSFDSCEQTVGASIGRGLANGRPAPGEAGQVHEVQIGAVAEPVEKPGALLDWQDFLERNEAVESKDGVVKVASSHAVLKAAIRVQALSQEGRDQVARLTQLLGRQPGDLQHLESQTHCTSP